MTAHGVARPPFVNRNPALICGFGAPDGVAQAHPSRYGGFVTRSDREGRHGGAPDGVRPPGDAAQPDG